MPAAHAARIKSGTVQRLARDPQRTLYPPSFTASLGCQTGTCTACRGGFRTRPYGAMHYPQRYRCHLRFSSGTIAACVPPGITARYQPCRDAEAIRFIRPSPQGSPTTPGWTPWWHTEVSCGIGQDWCFPDRRSSPPWALLHPDRASPGASQRRLSCRG